MSDVSQSLSQALGELSAEGETVESLADRLSQFPREAIADALTMLTDAGVLRRETGPDGTVRYFYADPSRYKLADMHVVRRPDARTGRRGG